MNEYNGQMHQWHSRRPVEFNLFHILRWKSFEKNVTRNLQICLCIPSSFTASHVKIDKNLTQKYQKTRNSVTFFSNFLASRHAESIILTFWKKAVEHWPTTVSIGFTLFFSLLQLLLVHGADSVLKLLTLHAADQLSLIWDVDRLVNIFKMAR